MPGSTPLKRRPSQRSRDLLASLCSPAGFMRWPSPEAWQVALLDAAASAAECHARLFAFRRACVHRASSVSQSPGAP